MVIRDVQTSKKPTQKEKGLINQNGKSGGKRDNTCSVQRMVIKCHMKVPNLGHSLSMFACPF